MGLRRNDSRSPVGSQDFQPATRHASEYSAFLKSLPDRPPWLVLDTMKGNGDRIPQFIALIGLLWMLATVSIMFFINPRAPESKTTLTVVAAFLQFDFLFSFFFGFLVFLSGLILWYILSIEHPD